MILSTDVETLFHRAMEKPPTERRDWLEAQTGWDRKVVVTVAELVAASEEAGCAATGGVQKPPVLGQRRGEFMILGHLGSGGHGAVYLARRDSLPNRLIALKVLHAHASAEVSDRFRNEQRALALTDHPGVVGILDVGQFPDGGQWIALPFVAGMTIDQFVRAKPLDVAARVSIALQVCDAVSHAHQRGLIHRDLKPSNVLVAEPNGEPRAVVIDFGLAKVLEDGPGQTIVGMPLGTPEFMAPEQAIGAPATTFMDIYGLGMILHAAISGAPRRTRESMAATGLPLATALTRVQPQRLTDLPGLRLDSVGRLSRRRISELEAVIAKATAVEPADRYQTVSALATDLERWLRGDAPEAAAPHILQTLRFAVRHHRRVAVASLSVAVVLVGVLMTSIVVAAQAEEARKQWESLYEFSRSMVVNSSVTSAGLPNLQRIRMDAETLAARLPVKDCTPMEALLLAEALTTTGGARDAEPYALKAVESFEAEGIEGLPLARAYMVIARARASHHDWPPSIGARASAMETLTGRIDEFDRRCIELRLLDLQLSVRHDTERAILELDQYSSLLGDHLDEQDPLLLGAVISASEARTFTGTPERCLLPAQVAASDCIRILGECHPLSLRARTNLALACMYSGLMENSREIYADLADDVADGYGKGSENSMSLLSNYGYTLHAMNRHEEAVDVLRRSLGGFRKLFGNDHPRTQLAAGNLMSALSALGRQQEADQVAAEVEVVKPAR